MKIEIEKVEDYLNGLKNDKFYGEVLIKFEHGKIVIAKENKSIKLSN